MPGQGGRAMSESQGQPTCRGLGPPCRSWLTAPRLSAARAYLSPLVSVETSHGGWASLQALFLPKIAGAPGFNPRVTRVHIHVRVSARVLRETCSCSICRGPMWERSSFPFNACVFQTLPRAWRFPLVIWRVQSKSFCSYRGARDGRAQCLASLWQVDSVIGCKPSHREERKQSIGIVSKALEGTRGLLLKAEDPKKAVVCSADGQARKGPDMVSGWVKSRGWERCGSEER